MDVLGHNPTGNLEASETFISSSLVSCIMQYFYINYNQQTTILLLQLKVN